jgi:hypothetical protein
VSKFDPKEIIDVKTVRGEIDQLLTEKLEFLSAVRVKKVRSLLLRAFVHVLVRVPLTFGQLVEDVIRNHLGWLIVWGNVFGMCTLEAASGITRSLGVITSVLTGGLIGLVSQAVGYGV